MTGAHVSHTMNTAMVAILVFRKLDLPLHLLCNSTSSISSIRSAMVDCSIYHVIVLGLGQELD